MALVVKFSVGNDTIKTVEIKRRGPYKAKGSERPDDVFRYIVRVDSEVVGHVLHRYGDDAMILMHLAIARWAEHGAGAPDPYPDSIETE